jgi:flagellar biogenesis protein FliO
MKITPTHLMLVAPPNSVPQALPVALTIVRRKLEGWWGALKLRTQGAPKLLRVGETRALGDRRFVVVVEFERKRFLIGSSPSAVTLLARLPDATPISRADGGGDTSEESRL